MNRTRTFLACVVTALAVSVPAAYAKGITTRKDSEKNDHVFVGSRDEFREYFKLDKDGGDKNYIYTITNQPLPKVGTCDIYTFNSEQFAFHICNPGVFEGQ